MKLFTLSHFRKELMMHAGNQFPEKYAAEKKSLSPKCKLFVQKQWNSSAWTEIPTTEMFVRLIKDQMMTKSRVKNGILQIRFSFGQAKLGQEFAIYRGMHNYVCEDFGEGIKFYQSSKPLSPYVRRVGKVKRENCWNELAQITDLVSSLYSSSSSKLHYGFLNEHGNSFFRIISANLFIHKDNSVFLPSLNYPDNHPLDDNIITNNLLSVFVRSHQNDVPGAPIPETNKYPPTNETMMIVPPTFREWKVGQQQQQFSIFSSHPITPAHGASNGSVELHYPPQHDELVGVTFKAS